MAQKKIAEVGELHTNDPKTGRPFGERSEASDFITKNELDPARFVPFENPNGSGWVVLDLKRLTDQQRPDGATKRQREENPLKIGPWWKVTFQTKRDENDTEDVYVSVNGVQRYFPREEPVVISNAFLLAVKAAVYSKFVHEPGRGRLVSKPMMRYPMNEVTAATEQEFLEFEQQLAVRRKAGARGQTGAQRAA